MKHRLASLGPTGRLWPSFLILLFFSFSFFLGGGVNAVPPSPSFFHLCIQWERLSPKLEWEGELVEEGVVGVFITSCVSLFKDLTAKSGRLKGKRGNGRLMEGEMMRR